MKSLRSYFLVCVIALLAFAVAVVGTGLSYRGHLTPTTSKGELYRIDADGWIEQGSTISFYGLAPRGNWAELSFNPWRPMNADPAQLRVKLCGSVVSEFSVVGAAARTVYLTGSCEPRELSFEVLNPVVGSPTDSRGLGAQLKVIDVKSKLGLPILAYETILSAWLIIAVASIIWFFAFPGVLGFCLALFLQLCAVFLLRAGPSLDYTNQFALGLFVSALGLGVLFARLYDQKRSFSSGEQVESGVSFSIVAALIVCGAALLRFYGLDFGLPNNYHPDEVPKIKAIMRMVDNGDLNPRYFLHPSLLLYSTYFVNKIMHLLGAEGAFDQTAYLAGRIVSATAGTLSVLLIYLAGARLFSKKVGLVSSAILAVLPLHVTCSRYLKEDSLLLFFTLLCLVAVLKAVQEDKPWILFAAGFFAGCSAGVKYSGLLSLAILGAAPWLKSQSFIPDKKYFGLAVLAGLMFPLAFVITTPYSVLDSAKFLKDLESERRHAARGHTVSIDAWSQLWMYHFSRSIIPGMAIFTALLGVVGAGYLLFRFKINTLFVLALILLFYLPAEWVKSKPAPQPERYILLCLPFMALAGAVLINALRASGYRVLAGLILIAAIGFPLIRSGQLASEIENDTRTQMANWMIANLPAGSKVYLDWKPYSPRFWNNEFEIEYIPRAEIVSKLSVNELKAAGKDYLVLSSLFYARYFDQPKSNPGIREKFRKVFSLVPVIKEFRPEYGSYGFHNPTVTLFSLKQQDFARLDQERIRKARGEIENTSNDVRASFNW